MGKLFERVARILFYTALFCGVYYFLSFEAMTAFGFGVLIVTMDELNEKIK